MGGPYYDSLSEATFRAFSGSIVYIWNKKYAVVYRRARGCQSKECIATGHLWPAVGHLEDIPCGTRKLASSPGRTPVPSRRTLIAPPAQRPPPSVSFRRSALP